MLRQLESHSRMLSPTNTMHPLTLQPSATVLQVLTYLTASMERRQRMSHAAAMHQYLQECQGSERRDRVWDGAADARGVKTPVQQSGHSVSTNSTECFAN